MKNTQDREEAEPLHRKKRLPIPQNREPGRWEKSMNGITTEAEKEEKNADFLIIELD